MTNADWRNRAACRGSDPELFFPIAEVGYSAAAAVCADCPVVSDCLEEALRVGDIHGYRGGHTGDERAGLLRARGHRRLRPPTPEEKVIALSAAGSTPREIAARLDAHVDSVRRILRLHRLKEPAT